MELKKIRIHQLEDKEKESDTHIASLKNQNSLLKSELNEANTKISSTGEKNVKFENQL